jgi:hypothetical protein
MEINDSLIITIVLAVVNLPFALFFPAIFLIQIFRLKLGIDPATFARREANLQSYIEQREKAGMPIEAKEILRFQISSRIYLKEMPREQYDKYVSVGVKLKIRGLLFCLIPTPLYVIFAIINPLLVFAAFAVVTVIQLIIFLKFNRKEKELLVEIINTCPELEKYKDSHFYKVFSIKK